jgi:hypothetical protein
LNFANQSFFLIKAAKEESSNFTDINGNIRFSMTFEVNGLEELTLLNKELKELGVIVGEIEERGHAGKNFVFNLCATRGKPSWSLEAESMGGTQRRRRYENDIQK